MRFRVPLLLLTFVSVSALALPHLALAHSIPYFGPIIEDGWNVCALGWGAVINVINNIITIALTIELLFIAPLMIAYGGFMLVVNPFKPDAKEKARDIIKNTVVGLTISLSAWLIVDAVMVIMYNPSAAVGNWQSLINGGGLAPCMIEAGSLNDHNVSAGQTVDAHVTGSNGGVTGYAGGNGAPLTSGTVAPAAGVGVKGAGIGNVDSVTTYTPYKCANIAEQSSGDSAHKMEGCQFGPGGTIHTVADYKYCLSNPTKNTDVGVPCSQVKSITVAVPQGSGIAHSQQFTWPELSRIFKLPDNTIYNAGDSYGVGRGFTSRGTYSVDVATCGLSGTAGAWNVGCSLPGKSNKELFQTRPTPVPGGK